MADSAASTQSRTTRASSTKRRANTVSTETENKLARAARSAQRLAQLSDASRDDSTLDMFPDDPTRATLDAMNIDIRQGTLHGFELPDVVLAAVGGTTSLDAVASASSDTRAARRAPREKVEPAYASVPLDGFERIEPTQKVSEPKDKSASAVGLNGLPVEKVDAPAPVVGSQPVLPVGPTLISPSMAAASLVRSVTARRQAAAGPSSVPTDAASPMGAAPQRFDATVAKAAAATDEGVTVSGGASSDGAAAAGFAAAQVMAPASDAVGAGRAWAGGAVGAAGPSATATASQAAGAAGSAGTSARTAAGMGTPREPVANVRASAATASSVATAASAATGVSSATGTASPVAAAARVTSGVSGVTGTTASMADPARSAAVPRSNAPVAPPHQDAAPTAPELDRARATAFADTVDALYGVISDQRRAATDHSRRMKWMLSIVVGALLATVVIGITQTVLLMRLTRETTAQQHRIEQLMQNQQTAMTSLLDAHLAAANATATEPSAAPASSSTPTVAPRAPAKAPAPASKHKAHAHAHKPKAAPTH